MSSSTSLISILEKLSPDLKHKVGDVLLGDDEFLTKLQGADTDDLEANTPWEKKLYQLLARWVQKSTDTNANQLASLKVDLDKLKKEFPTMVQPPQGELAFRGTQVKSKSLRLALERQRGWRLVNYDGQKWILLPKVPYSPNRKAQSWSTRRSIAGSFVVQRRTTIPVIYSTKINRDFIMSSDALAIIYGGTREYEVIRIAEKGTFSAMLPVEHLIDEFLVHHLPGVKRFFQQPLIQLNLTSPKHYTSWDDFYEKTKDFNHIGMKLYYQASKRALRAGSSG